MSASDFNRGIRHGRKDAKAGVDGQSARVRAFERILHAPMYLVASLRRQLEHLETGREERLARRMDIEEQSVSTNLFGAGPNLATWVYGTIALVPFCSELVLMRQVTNAALGDSGFGTTTFPTLLAVVLLVSLGDLVIGTFLSLKEADSQKAWVPFVLASLLFVVVIGGLGWIRSDLFYDPDQAGSQYGPVAIFLLAAAGSTLAMGFCWRQLWRAMKLKGEFRRICCTDRKQKRIEDRLAKAESVKEFAETRIQNYQDGYQQGIDLAVRNRTRG